jgi:hypothetical protein
MDACQLSLEKKLKLVVGFYENRKPTPNFVNPMAIINFMRVFPNILQKFGHDFMSCKILEELWCAHA